MKYLILILSLSFSAVANAGVSAARLPTESFEEALSKNTASSSHTVLRKKKKKEPAVSAYDPTALDLKKSMSRTDLLAIPELGSMEELNSIFYYIRDTRFLQTDNPYFPRRLTWLYPDDGCFARAEVATFEINAFNPSAILPKKVFAFGNLRARTNNSSSGFVSWWYHVAVSYRIGTQVYILDPAIEPEFPMTLEQWHDAIRGDTRDVLYTVCSTHTYDPTDGCSKPNPVTPVQVIDDQKGYLRSEWTRLLRLNRQPEQELGENPPWSHH